jgi:hypothetical protein
MLGTGCLKLQPFKAVLKGVKGSFYILKNSFKKTLDSSISAVLEETPV